MWGLGEGSGVLQQFIVESIMYQRVAYTLLSWARLDKGPTSDDPETSRASSNGHVTEGLVC